MEVWGSRPRDPDGAQERQASVGLHLETELNVQWPS